MKLLVLWLMVFWSNSSTLPDILCWWGKWPILAKVMMVTLWWWQFSDVGGRIIMLVIFLNGNNRSPTLMYKFCDVTILLPAFQTSHQHITSGTYPGISAITLLLHFSLIRHIKLTYIDFDTNEGYNRTAKEFCYHFLFWALSWFWRRCLAIKRNLSRLEFVRKTRLSGGIGG